MRQLWLIWAQLTFLSIIAFVYILFIWKNLIIPFILSLLIAMVIIWTANFFKRFKYTKYISMPLSLGLLFWIWYAMVSLINSNINDVVQKLPVYQEKFSEIAFVYTERFNLDEIIDVKELLLKIDFWQILGNAFSSVMDVFSSLWMILFLTVFIILESRHFSDKLKKMFTTRIRYNKTIEILKTIQSDVKSYFVIKAIISIWTAVSSYIFMKIIGLDFAEFWALLIFILNFIPNIWSMIAVFFPIMLSIVQYDWIIMFVVTTTILVWIQFLMWNLIEPRYLWNKLNLSPLVILISLAFWGTLWWVIWMLLSVPIIVVINIILSKFKSTRGFAVLMSEEWNIKV